MADPLSGPRAKLARAAEHLKAIDTASDAFFHDNPHSYPIKKGAGLNQHIITVEGIVPVPVDIALLIGDCLHNLRSCLDHIVYQLWHSDDAAFPIFNSANGFKSWGLKMISGVTQPGAKAVIEGLQPYQPGNGGKQNLLWYLRELSNADKHRLLHLTSISLLGSTYQPVAVHNLEFRLQGPLNLGVLRNGAELAMLTTRETGSDAAMEVRVQLLLAIAFNEFGAGRGEAALDLLTNIHKVVGENLLPMFDQFFK